jgi:hypothetical protein
MWKKVCHLGLVSAASIGLASLPARADTATVQGGSQNATISGDNNQVTQIINQTIINHPGRGTLNRSPGKKKDEVQYENEQSDRGNHYGNLPQNEQGDRNGRKH